MTEKKQLYFNTNIIDNEQALERFNKVRELTERLAAPLSPEDTTVQSMLEASPTKWHLAHTSWYFETFILKHYLPSYQPFNNEFHYLFNSYYQGAGPQFDRDKRGLLSRPTLAEIMDYRSYVTKAMTALIDRKPAHENWLEIVPLLDLGCHHEEQHQELLLTDIKHALFINPLKPAYRRRTTPGRGRVADLEWLGLEDGVYEIGHNADGFAFDCEGPRHKVFLYDFELASRPVTNREYLQFVKDGGYENPKFWLAEGWELAQKEGWKKPLYWLKDQGHNAVFTLFGIEPLNPNEPVSHISYYEADAYARWARKLWSGARLPSEAELEVAAEQCAITDDINDLANDRLHPIPSGPEKPFTQLFGDVWEWTSSSFSSYPNFIPSDSVVGEYNGKFMTSQMVLKGGSCVTPHNHMRPSYRNFFYPNARWQFSGLRLARSTARPETEKPNIDVLAANIANKKQQSAATDTATDTKAEAKAETAKEQKIEESKAVSETKAPAKAKADKKTKKQKSLSSVLSDDILGDDFLNSSDIATDSKNDMNAIAKANEAAKVKADFIDLKPTVESFRGSVLKGLQQGPKVLSAKHLYDVKGSELFTKITQLEEYYPTETEKGILRRRIRSIAQQLAEKVQLVEFGSGSGDKVRILLRALEHFDAYVPIDISREILMHSADELATEFPNVTITAICADYTKRVDLPPPTIDRAGNRLGFFPGSTIGNFSRKQAKEFLERAGTILGSGAGLIVGVDLKKDKATLEAAYNDSKNITAKFNLNILDRINRELDGNFKVNNFEHLAFYNEQEARIEMHLVSLKKQKVNIAGEEISFSEGETIHTESSHKYSIDEFKQLVMDAGLKHSAVWEDREHLFSVHFIKIP